MALVQCQKQYIITQRLTQIDRIKEMNERKKNKRLNDDDEDVDDDMNDDIDMNIEEETVVEALKVEEEEDLMLDLTVDLRPCLNSFHHNVINDITIMDPKRLKMEKKKKKHDNDENEEEDEEDDQDRSLETVDRLYEASIVKLDLSIILPSYNKKAENVEEEEEEEDADQKKNKKKKRRATRSSSRGLQQQQKKKKAMEEEENKVKIRYLTKKDAHGRVFMKH